MKHSPFHSHISKRGRPREITLNAEQENRYIQLVLLANVAKKKGSASMAWRVFCREHPELGWDPHQRASKHQLPAVARELARKANGLVSLHRQGERGLRSSGTYTPGMIRRDSMGTRRLYGGEHGSWDDATVNFGVVIPWAFGGCKLSDRYGVKLGRFQLLLNHDEATSFVPAWCHVIRESQGYRGTDVAEAVMRVARDVCIYKALVLEGGVWQGRRMARVMEGMGTELISVKGRPQCKLVENFFNRLWTRLGMEKGLASVGRFRGEEKDVSEFYVKCRAGNADPRGKFPWLAEAVEGMERSIRFLNSDRVESPIYGKWVPEERWEMDMQEHPRPLLDPEKLWMAAPVMEKRRVSRNGLIATATGPLGLKMRYQFTGPCLWEWEGKDVEIYFDPLGEWPIHGIVARPGSATPLGRVECQNPYHEGGTGADAAKNLREVMRREYRCLWNGKHLKISDKESAIRGLDSVITLSRRSEADPLMDREKNHGPQAAEVIESQPFNSGGRNPLSGVGRLAIETCEAGGQRGISPAPGDRSAEPLRSLSRKAAAARDLEPNW